MKHKIKTLIQKAALKAHEQGELRSSTIPPFSVEESKSDIHGDFASNFAMTAAAAQKMAPRKIAETVIKYLDADRAFIAKTEIAGPGFINFFIRPAAWHLILNAIHTAGTQYGASDIGSGQKIQVEFVSANPTGPLHVGHGRGAAVGDSVANILSFSGYQVEKEYYINDSGRQINTLGKSVFLRYLASLGKKTDFPDDCYKGDYIKDLAAEIGLREADQLASVDEQEAIALCARLAAAKIIAGIRQDLNSFGITFDNWFSEQSLYDSGKVDAVLQNLRKQELIYPKDGALWFKTTAFGDEKDRVVVRKNGLTTYFASDIAYHLNKFERGFDRLIDVWGADHHGYCARLTACVEASGHKRDQFSVILVKLVNLLRKGKPVAMSTRAGEFVTLQEVIDEVGRDAARFLFLTRSYDSPLDFDLDLAKRQTNDNPVYYVQYVHARITSITRKADKQGLKTTDLNHQAVSRLTSGEEIRIIKLLARFPETVQHSAETMAPHRITFYLMELAAAFHSYYNKHRVLADDTELACGRLYLIAAVKIVIRNGLALLGVSAPEKM
ncbi:arginine--tRNA ligase [Desulfococcaceae bacterium HSG9]|nr:arginine--tRNA ligase [Desulfococcaceae bacterium HSG9]